MPHLIQQQAGSSPECQIIPQPLQSRKNLGLHASGTIMCPSQGIVVESYGESPQRARNSKLLALLKASDHTCTGSNSLRAQIRSTSSKEPIIYQRGLSGTPGTIVHPCHVRDSAEQWVERHHGEKR